MADSNQHGCIDHRARRTGIECQAKNRAPGGSGNLCTNDYKTLMGIERIGHNTIAVSFGIVPVNNIANRLGLSSTAQP